MSLINCVAKIFAAQKMQWVFFCHYTIFSCAIVYVAFLTSNAMHKIMQSKRNVRLTIDSFIFAINLKLEQFDKTFSCCVLYVVYKYILNRKWNALIVDVWLRKMLHRNNSSSTNNECIQSLVVHTQQKIITILSFLSFISHAFFVCHFIWT